MAKISKVVIPVAGLGTRMLPATKAIPKEMLPIAGKPLIQYIVEEIKQAGFNEIILITHSSKSSIEDHFDTSFELEAALDKKIKKSLLKEINNISKLGITFQSIRQGEAKGLGHAILMASEVLKKEPFAVVLPDMLIQSLGKGKNLSLMKKSFDKNNISSILLAPALKKDIPKYGIAKIRENKNRHQIGYLESIIEKPSIKNAPSNLFAAGRYIFTYEIMNFLKNNNPDKNNEIQLTSAIDSFLKSGHEVIGYSLEGKVHDCGNKIGYSIANFEYSKIDPEIGSSFKKYIKKNV